MVYTYDPTEDHETRRRRITREGRRISARAQANGPSTARRKALEHADWADANGMPNEAAYYRDLADFLIPPQFRWAFTEEDY